MDMTQFNEIERIWLMEIDNNSYLSILSVIVQCIRFQVFKWYDYTIILFKLFDQNSLIYEFISILLCY